MFNYRNSESEPNSAGVAQRLSIFTGRKFSEAEMLPYAHAMIDLPDDDPRREKLGLALSDAYEAWEDGNFGLMARHELEFWTALFRLKQ